MSGYAIYIQIISIEGFGFLMRDQNKKKTYRIMYV